jgi:hypothetical protein
MKLLHTKTKINVWLILLLFLLGSKQAGAVDIATPLQYTALLMTVEFAAVFALDMNEDSLSSSNFKNAWRHPSPAQDNDNFFVNGILHPLMGSETYLRAREGDFGVGGSIAFSMAASITWEYLIESWTEHPSTQDLVLTTGVGWMLGELRYQIKQINKQHGRSNFWVDPIWKTLEYLDFNITKQENTVAPTLCLKFTF